ncbi:hypothetical protein PYCC9005_002118 [Savitreella phatthalungensis]
MLFSAAALLTAVAFAAPVVNDIGSFEFIVVGSGAGGGPLASRLAQAGRKTLLIEAGDDQTGNVNVTVPAFQAAVTEDPQIAWDFFVNHYKNFDQAKRDSKYVYGLPNGGQYVGLNPPAGAKPKGIFYPRAGTLGGCATHNALITVYPHESDWNYIAQLTGDDSWSAANMRKYFVKLERNQYLPNSVIGHGFSGWLRTAQADVAIVLKDSKVVRWLVAAAAVAGNTIPGIDYIAGLTQLAARDVNAYLPGRDSTGGYYQIPLHMEQSTASRSGPLQLIRDTVAQGYPLTVRTNCHVTKVVFDSNKTATGVEFLDGAHLYRASPLSGGSGTPGRATASKEIILSGGAYNTPQILKLSGVGPAAELQQFGIDVVKDAPAVGTNLQDRYEIGTVYNTTGSQYTLLQGCTFDGSANDKCIGPWRNNPNVLGGKGAYATDGLAAAILSRSTNADDSNIDSFLFGGPVQFLGYQPNWSRIAVDDKRSWTWAALKAHTRNTAGTVTLRSSDPLDVPEVNFNYFSEGSAGWEKDLAAMVQMVTQAREIGAQITDFTEQHPGSVDAAQWIQDEAWGHHASCTAPIGADNDPNAVLDSGFRVRGVNQLSVVDASVFPKIPGIFIVTPIYMISEKAADVILARN